MAKVNIVESGMTFQIEEENLYHIEKTELYKSLGDNIKRPEFMICENGIFIFIEAKKSSPRAKDETRCEPDPLRVWCEEIKEKFVNALILFNTTRMHRHGASAYKELPPCSRKVNLGKANYCFYLVINGHQREWLAPIMYRLKVCMSPALKMWNIKDSAIKVINEQMAKGKQLIV